MRLQGVAYTGGYDAAGLPHGNGKMTFKDGDTYEGEYMNGERHGQGTEMIGDSWDDEIVSTVYVGTFHHNQRHGLGKMTYNIDPNSDCDDYSDDEGEWKNGLFLGNNNNQQ